MSYCSAAAAHPILQAHHDKEHGFPIYEDDKLFECLMLEVNQAGLSWLTVMKKREALQKAYANFSCQKVANFKQQDIERLLQDSGIIRNRLKIKAAIFNAQKICEIQKSHGSFAKWLEKYRLIELESENAKNENAKSENAKTLTSRARNRQEWVKLFRKNFNFVGFEIVGEFLMAIGHLQGAHVKECPIYQRVLAKKPPWVMGGAMGEEMGGANG